MKNSPCSLSNLALGINGLEQVKRSCVVLPLNCHQCSIHCKSRHAGQSAKQVEMGNAGHSWHSNGSNKHVLLHWILIKKWLQGMISSSGHMWLIFLVYHLCF